MSSQAGTEKAHKRAGIRSLLTSLKESPHFDAIDRIDLGWHEVIRGLSRAMVTCRYSSDRLKC